MTESKGKYLLSSVAGNLAVFVVLPLVLNGLIFGLGWDRQSAAAKGQMAGLPPGWAVGAIWMVLFIAMGSARWLLLKRHAGRLVEGPSVLAFLCLLYPLYTSGLQNDRVGLIGTLITAAVALPLSVSAWRWSRSAAGCMAAVCAWLLYAAAITAYNMYR